MEKPVSLSVPLIRHSFPSDGDATEVESWLVGSRLALQAKYGLRSKGDAQKRASGGNLYVVCILI